jgi:hypothetical protein
LTKLEDFWHPGIVHIIQKQGLSPNIFEEVKLLEIWVIEHKDLKNILLMPLEDVLTQESEAVLIVVQGLKSLKRLFLMIIFHLLILI